jgi:hypothetical protein
MAKIADITKRIEASSNILAMRDAKFVFSTKAIESLATQHSQDILTRVGLLNDGIKLDEFMNNDELNTLFEKFGKLSDQQVENMSAFSTKTNKYVMGHTPVGAEINPMLKSMSETVSGYKLFFSELSKLSIYKDGKEIIDL